MESDEQPPPKKKRPGPGKNRKPSDEVVRRVAHHVRTRREQLGLTLEEAAAKTTLNMNQICDIENWRGTNPCLSTLEALAEALECEVWELVTEDYDHFNDKPLHSSKFFERVSDQEDSTSTEGFSQLNNNC